MLQSQNGTKVRYYESALLSPPSQLIAHDLPTAKGIKKRAEQIN